MKKYIFLGLGLGTKNPAGIHRNTLELLKEIDKTEFGKHCEILLPRSEEISYRFKNITVVKVGDIVSGKGKQGLIHSKISRFVWKNITIQKYLKNKEAVSIDLLFVFPLKPCNVVCLYDCIPEFTPEYYDTLNLKYKRWKLIKNQKPQLKKCDVLLTDSNYAKSQIVDFYKIPEQKINVVYCAWQHFLNIREDETIIERLGLQNKDFYFALGSRSPHKNIKWIAKAAGKNINDEFIVSGQHSAFVDTSFEGEIPPNMKFCGYLTDGEVKVLMKRCKAFIQPSFYEGFGIPPMEAMSVGADCIVSNRASLPEVYKNSVWYIDPEDYDNVDLNEIMTEPKESNDLILAEYSWEKSAGKLIDILSAV